MKLGQYSATRAISADATSQQADFIRRLKEQCDHDASETTALRRNSEDYMTSISKTEAFLQGALAEHCDQMAAARQEHERLSQRLLARQRTHGNLIDENSLLTSQAAQLRADIQPNYATIEQLTLQTDGTNINIPSLTQRYNDLHADATAHFRLMIDPAVLQEQSDTNDMETVLATNRHIARVD